MEIQIDQIFSKKDRKIALVLGGGSARGLAHLGVLKVFKREGIKVDFIVGTSIGALIGAVYALDIGLDAAIEKALNMTWKDVVDINMPGLGFSKGRKLKNVITETIQGKDFKDIKIPLAIVSTDIENYEEVVFLSTRVQKLSLADAIKASSALPGVYEPVRLGDRLLIDGGVIDSVPVMVAQKLGADFIIAVDVGFCIKKGAINNILQVLIQTIQIAGQELNNLQAQHADILIKPQLGQDIDQMAFDKAGYIIAKGEYAAEAMIPVIKRKLKFASISKFLPKLSRHYRKPIKIVEI